MRILFDGVILSGAVFSGGGEDLARIFGAGWVLAGSLAPLEKTRGVGMTSEMAAIGIERLAWS